MDVPFVDLKSQYFSIKSEIIAEITKVLDSGQFVLGSAVSKFEEEFAAYCGSKYGIAVNSGTSALHLAMLAAGVGPGDEVITVPATFVATVAAIGYTGATPVFVDVDPVTYTMDPALIEAAITPKTKAIVPVHLYGNPADMDPIMEVAQRHGRMVIEDAAQAHGAEYRGRRCGSIGDLGCFSFYPGKNLGAYGEGGLVSTSNPDFAKTIRMLRDWGAEKKYEHVLKGYNYRMDGVQGAILGVKFQYLEQWTEARRDHASTYQRLLAESQLTLPTATANSRHVYHVYATQTEHRAELGAFLGSRGIQSGIHYPYPIHLLLAYSELGHKVGDFPVSEGLASRELSLPMYPEISLPHLEAVAAAISEFESLELVGHVSANAVG